MNPNNYKYSFSGADCRSYAWFDQYPGKIVPIESMQTISISVYEAKGDVRSLGYRGIKGVTKSIRTIAGSIILTVVNDHPWKGLLEAYAEAQEQEKNWRWELGGWSLDRSRTGVGSFSNSYDLTNFLPTLFPKFNVGLQFATELSFETAQTSQGLRHKVAGVLIKGVELLTDGLVVSINDIYSEMTFSFKAHDYKPMAIADFNRLWANQANKQEVVSSPRLTQDEEHRAVVSGLLPLPPPPEVSRYIPPSEGSDE